jgi:hypothetical protein
MSRRKREAVKVTAHLPPEQKFWIEEQAQRNLSSQNSEIVRAIRFRMESEQQPERAVG